MRASRSLASRRGCRHPRRLPRSSPGCEAIASLHSPRSDGIACFARLYLAVTEGVQARLAGSGFSDPRFLARLDVVFADLFFAAARGVRARSSAQTPRAWLPLFEARSRRGIAPLQFALAGMNAHINRDLPVALVATCHELGLRPARGSARSITDFERVNDLLAVVEAQVKQQYLSGWLRAVERLLHRVDRSTTSSRCGTSSRAREAAWVNAETLWAIGDDADLTEDHLASLDRMTGFAGRGLLVPADTLGHRLGCRLLGRGG